MKKILLAVILLSALTMIALSKCNAQVYAETGINSLKFGVSLAGGYNLNKIDLNAGWDANVYSISTLSGNFHENVGYEFGSNLLITPSIGVGETKITEDRKDGAPELNFVQPYFSLRISKEYPLKYDDGRVFRLFAFTSYSHDLYGGIGIRIYPHKTDQ